MDDGQLQFHIQEYIALRAEIMQRIAEEKTIEHEVIIGSFLTYAWVIKTSQNLMTRCIALLLPVLLAAASIPRLWAQDQRIRQLGKYISVIEEQILLAKNNPAANG